MNSIDLFVNKLGNKHVINPIDSHDIETLESKLNLLTTKYFLHLLESEQLRGGSQFSGFRGDLLVCGG